MARKLIANGENGHKLNFPDDDTKVYAKVTEHILCCLKFLFRLTFLRIQKRKEKDQTIQKILKTTNRIRIQKSKNLKGTFEEKKFYELFSAKNSFSRQNECLILSIEGVKQNKLIKKYFYEILAM